MDEPTNADQKRTTYLKVTNYSPSNNTDLSRIPKRKLSVFYGSFDLIEQIDPDKGKETLDIRRTSSSPSVRIERTQEEDLDSRKSDEKIILQKRGLVSNYRSLIESGKFLSSSSPDRLSERSSSSNLNVSKALSSPSTGLPQVREGTIVDNYSTITGTSIGQCYKLNDNGNYQLKTNVESVAIDPHQSSSSPDLTDRSLAGKKIDGTSRSTNALVCSRTTTCTDLVKIKNPEYPRSFANASRGRLRKYTSVDAEMSSHEDSSIGSDSEDESIERNLHGSSTRDEVKIARRRSKSNSPSLQPLSPFLKEPLREAEQQEETVDLVEPCLKEREKRQRLFAERRSLSDSNYERQRAKSLCTKEIESFKRREELPAFPSFNDARLQAMGLSTSEDIDSVYRETIRENELERKYIAFSIGLSTDRITLSRRMTLSLRQRDQSERNFTHEIQKMQEDIKDICSLCTDQESIEKVEKVRHRLDMIARSAHRVSCAAESLGAVYQEHRMSRAIFIGDKYLQLLRTRCENLATEIADTKQILLKNNIVIEESSGEIGNDLPKIRYRNGLPCNNRTMVARRRASIATISRPLTSQDAIKEAPRQRNSVSGRVTLRRPSLCSETQRWENEKLNRADSANSVIELREIFEHTESRRNSVEENNNLLRMDQNNSMIRVNGDIVASLEDKDRLTTKKHSFLESNVTKTVEKQLKSCIRTAEPFRITRNIETWRPILWFMVVFFLGFYTKQFTSSLVT